MRPISAIALVSLTLAAAPAPRAQSASAGQAGITGVVLAPDGSPVTQGSVLLMRSPTLTATAAIDRHGSFRIVPDVPGAQGLFISVPGFAPYRAIVMVPPSRIVKLPAITLLDATHFTARFVTADGEPLGVSGLRRRSVDTDGDDIPDPLGHVRERTEANGSVVIGPLPRGKLLLAFVRPGVAQTRLPDINVTGAEKLIDRGVIPIQPGATLRVHIKSGDGSPVPRHDVWIEDAVQPSPLSFQPERTNAEGRAVFENLGPGRYRVWTQTIARCGTLPPLAISRLVSSSGNGETEMRIVIEGRASFRLTSAQGPVFGRTVFAAPDAPSHGPFGPALPVSIARRMRAVSSPVSCSGRTDQDGRVTITPLPPGPTEVRVRLFNSTFITRVTVPEGGREIVMTVPDGLMPVHVIDRESQHPIGLAQVTWTGGGGRVEALATPNGDVLLEAVGSIGGTLAVNAREYQEVEGVFEETPGTQQDVALLRLPSERMPVRVMADGKPLPGAVVELSPRAPGDAAVFTTTDTAGVATLRQVPPGSLRLTGHAEGFTPVTVTVPEDGRASVVVSLTRVTPQH